MIKITCQNVRGIAIILILMITGCQQTRYEASMIHPYCEERYQECKVNLSGYKSPQERAGQDANIAAAVAISGGGFRASNFSAGVLDELEKIANPSRQGDNILAEVDYFSTVSGGGFMASTYISSLHDYIRAKGTTAGYSFATALNGPTDEYLHKHCPCAEKDATVQDYITDPCIRRHLRGFYSAHVEDLVSDILCWMTHNLLSRGGHFERIIDDSFLGYRFRKIKTDAYPPERPGSISLTMGDIFISKDDPNAVKLPYWVTNTTAYENGAIFTFTPDQFRLYKITGYKHRTKQYCYKPGQQSYEDFLRSVPFAAGVMASANFPGATLPTSLCSEMDSNNPYLYLYDGGMADNSGVVTAIRLLDSEQCKTISKKVLIVVDAYQGTFAPFSKINFPPSPLNTAARAMMIYQDSWRGRYREIAAFLCKAKGISAVFLSFDELDDLDSCDALKEFGLSDSDIKSLTEKSKLKRPFELLRNIPMLNVSKKGLLSKAEQNLLLSAGRYTVKQKAGEITKAMGW